MTRYLISLVSLCLILCKSIAQEKEAIPGLVPLALQKGRYEVNSYLMFNTYKEIESCNVWAGGIQFTYGVEKFINVGIDINTFLMKQTITSGDTEFDIQYKVLNIGPRIRVPLYNSPNQRTSVTMQNSVLFPLTRSLESNSAYISNADISSTKPIIGNQIILMNRIDYDFFTTFQVDLFIYPKVGEERKAPLSLPVTFLMAYALDTHWMVMGLMNYTSEFRSVSWTESPEYYQTSSAFKLGLGGQGSPSKNLLISLTYMLPLAQQSVDENWVASNSITLGVRWKI